ncbi:MAG: hypothetical protein C0392_02845 [Syntrophus sp. (in: bacteria)]|nr:hypothetical protein [Syntrophus sp. (in: bacteria)]
MALTIQDSADMVLKKLAIYNFHITKEQETDMRKNGYCRLAGFNCKVANIRGGHSFRVRVNLDWFRGSQKGISKPYLDQGCQPEFDFQFFPLRSKLLAVYYLDLHSYCLELEKDRRMWFNQPYWGMQVDPDKEEFCWAGGNTRRFHLLRVSCPDDLRKASEKHVST